MQPHKKIINQFRGRNMNNRLIYVCMLFAGMFSINVCVSDRVVAGEKGHAHHHDHSKKKHNSHNHGKKKHNSHEHGKKRQLDSHEHGVSVLKIASEKNMIEMELESPADDIVGFEHAPENVQQREKISKAIAVFKDKAGLFFPNVEAQCKITKNSAEFEADAGSGHAGFHVKWHLSCANLSKIQVLSTSFFKIFPKAKEIEVEVVSDAGQREIEWDSDQTKIKLKLTK